MTGGRQPNLLRASGLLGVATAFVRLSNVGVIALLGRAEGAESVGLYGLATVAASFVSLALSLGFPTYMTRSVAAGVVEHADVHRVHWWRGAGVVIGTLALSIFASIAVPTAAMVGFVLFATTALLDHWNETAWALVRGTRSAGREPFVSAVGYLLVLGTCVPLYLTSSLTFVTAALAAFGGALLRSTLSITAVSLWRARGSVTSSLRSQVRSAISYWLSDLLGLAYLRGDIAILTIWVTAVSLGHYVAATALTTPLVQVAAAMSAGALAVVARAGRTEQAQDRNVMQFFAASGLAVGATLSWAFPIVVPALFGDDYSEQVVTLAAIVVMFLPLKFFNFGLQSILLAGGQPGIKVAILSMSVVLNALLNLWWAPTFGVAGAAWATVLTEVVVLFFYLSTRSVHFSSSIAPAVLLLSPIALASAAYGLASLSGSESSLVEGVLFTIAFVFAAALSARSLLRARELAAHGPPRAPEAARAAENILPLAGAPEADGSLESPFFDRRLNERYRR